jgi:surface protein
VFAEAYAFNEDLNQWDVAAVTYMSYSKSIRIAESDVTVNSCYFDWWVQSGFGVGGDDVSKDGIEVVLK